MRLAALGSSIVLAIASTALGQAPGGDAEDGETLFRAAEFERAEEAFVEMLATSSIDAPRRAVFHAHLAAIRIVFGDEQGAREHALRAVSHDLGVSPPEGAPRTLEPMLEEVRARIRRLELRLSGTRSPDRPSHGTVVLEVISPPDPILVAIDLHCASADGTSEDAGEPLRRELFVVWAPTRCAGAGRGSEGTVLVSTEATLFGDAFTASPPDPPHTVPDIETTDGGSALTAVLVLGGGVLVAGVVVAILLATGGGDDGPRVGSTTVLGWP